MADSERKLGVDKKNVIIVILLTVCVFLGGYTVYNAVTSSETPSSTTGSTVGAEKVSKQEILDLATKMLVSVGGEKPLDDAEFEGRLAKLDEGDFSVIPEDVKNNIRFADFYANSPEKQGTAYQSLLIISQLIKNHSQNGTITPSSDTAFENVYLDKEAGVAFVPLSIYTGEGNIFSIGFVYDGQNWVLEPYSLISSVEASVYQFLQNGGENTVE